MSLAADLRSGCVLRLLASNHKPVTAGKTTVNSLYGTRVAVLAGDYLFAQSSWHLAQLDNLEVCARLLLAEQAVRGLTQVLTLLLGCR